MGTSYPVYKKDGIEIFLDEGSCKFRLCTRLEGPHSTLVDLNTHYMEEEEVVNLVTKILGPLYYWNPDGDMLERVSEKLKEGGYT